MTNIANNLKSLRKSKKLSQQRVSDLTGISRGKISTYEQGTTEPNLCTLVKLAKFYGISVDTLIK